MVAVHEMMQSVESMQSTLRKLENSKKQMMQKGASTTLVSKRLQAVEIGLALLEYKWSSKPYNCAREEILAARQVLNGLMPSLQKHVYEVKNGQSPKNSVRTKNKSNRTFVRGNERNLHDSTID